MTIPRRLPRAVGLACVALLVATLAPPAAAQRDQAVGVFFDPGATARTRRAAPLTAFDAFVITFNLDLPSKRLKVLGGFEVGVQVDARLIVLDRSPLPYLTVEATDRDGLADDNWIVDTSQCVEGHGTVRLLRYVVLLAAPADDVIVCLQAPRDGVAQPPAPVWLDCQGAPRPLAYVRDLAPSLRTGCGVVNPAQPLSPSDASWSAVKARFTRARG